jgi:hypothetical protein
MNQVVQHLPGKPNLSSNTSTTQNKIKQKRDSIELE